MNPNLWILLQTKAPKSHKEMMILQGFNPETGYLTTFVKHCEQAETTDKIAMAKFSASDEESNSNKNKKRSKKTKELEDSGDKLRKNSSLYCNLYGENKGHTSR